MQQYRAIAEQGSGKGWMGEQGEGRRLMGLLGRWDPRRGKSFEM